MRQNAKEITISTGTKFASLMIKGDFSGAHSLLSKGLKAEYTADLLKYRFGEMVSYGHGPAYLDGNNQFMENWPTRRAQDIGWSYISISGPDFAEAVTVVVSDEDGKAKISSIEWGRP
jgi:hypothetical protein